MKFYLSNFICLLSLVQVSNNDMKDLFEKVFKTSTRDWIYLIPKIKI